MKRELCEAFCGELEVREVPAGLAVSTAFNSFTGEPIGFYIVGPDETGNYRIEDDGTTIPGLEAAGADIENRSRLEAFTGLLAEYGVSYDYDSAELSTPSLPQAELPAAAMRFVALLMRVQDLLFMAPERAASTFKEDALREIRAALEGEPVMIREGQPVHPALAEFIADVVLESEARDPVAVFFASTEQRVYEAILMQMAAQFEAHVRCSVIALLESGNTIGHKMRQRASNRLAAVPDFRGDEKAAVGRIAREITGPRQALH